MLWYLIHEVPEPSSYRFGERQRGAAAFPETEVQLLQGGALKR